MEGRFTGTEAFKKGSAHVVIVKQKADGALRCPLVLQSFARTIPGVGIYFSTYYSLKQHFYQDDRPGPLPAVLLGGGARTVAGVLMLPVTVIKTRFEVSKSRRLKLNVIIGSWCGAVLSVSSAAVWQVQLCERERRSAQRLSD